ncbi:MAG: DUF2513 domain-containing protein [Desulfobulbaceae bacterium]|nr:DUF2513 domain-containing protein [Desulfobulbaceae bacterium]
MKRNWDSIRLILVRLEELGKDKQHLNMSDFEGLDIEDIGYNAHLLIERGLIEGKVIFSSRSLTQSAPQFVLYRLTWEGHELLDAIRNDTIWRKTKSTFASKSLDMTFDLVKKVATDLMAAVL